MPIFGLFQHWFHLPAERSRLYYTTACKPAYGVQGRDRY